MKPNLTFRDGFNFGCGFFVAGLVYTLVMLLLLTVVMFIITVEGLSALPR